MYEAPLSACRSWLLRLPQLLSTADVTVALSVDDVDFMRDLFEAHVEAGLAFVRTGCTLLIQLVDVQMVACLCCLLQVSSAQHPSGSACPTQGCPVLGLSCFHLQLEVLPHDLALVHPQA